MITNWYSISAEEALKQTGSNPNGLNDDAVKQKLAEHGKNELKAKKKTSPHYIFLPFFNGKILVLGVTAVLSAFIRELTDNNVILNNLVLNAVNGFIQEYRDKKTMDALQKMAAASSHVLRNGHSMEIASEEIV